MTTSALARSYFVKARKRLRALLVLLEDDDDFIPTDEYTREEAERAVADAKFVLGLLHAFPDPAR